MALRLLTRATLRVAPLAPMMIGMTGCSEKEPAMGAPATTVTVAKAELAPRATLTELRGNVQVKRASDDEWAAGTEGMALFENDKVRTVAGARVDVLFANGSTVTVDENALVSVAETQTRPGEERTDLTVFEGRVDALLPDADKQSLTVTTPAATVRAGREIVFQ